MFSSKLRFLSLSLFAIESIVCVGRATAQDPVVKFCSSEFFSSEQSQWEKRDFEFHLLRDGSFLQDGNTYVLAVAFEGEAKARASEEVQFLIFRSPVGQQKFTAVHSEKIGAASFGDFSVDADGCVTTGAGPYFHVSAVDLAGNGKRQIIVESNTIGACSSCLSFVRVYDIQGDKVVKVVEETCNDIKFGHGKGLWIHSFKVDSKGQPVPYERSFFAQTSSGKGPNH